VPAHSDAHPHRPIVLTRVHADGHASLSDEVQAVACTRISTFVRPRRVSGCPSGPGCRRARLAPDTPSGRPVSSSSRVGAVTRALVALDHVPRSAGRRATPRRPRGSPRHNLPGTGPGSRPGLPPADRSTRVQRSLRMLGRFFTIPHRGGLSDGQPGPSSVPTPAHPGSPATGAARQGRPRVSPPARGAARWLHEGLRVLQRIGRGLRRRCASRLHRCTTRGRVAWFLAESFVEKPPTVLRCAGSRR